MFIVLITKSYDKSVWCNFSVHCPNNKILITLRTIKEMVWELHQKTINPIPFQLPEKRAKLQIHLYIKTFTYDTNIKIKKIYFNL